MKYTAHYLRKLEDLLAESDFILRYEKGSFQSGYCVLNDKKVILVNNYYPLDGKINCLLEIVRTVPLNTSQFSEKNRKFFLELTQPQLSIGGIGEV
jgi:hypothetical protein